MRILLFLVLLISAAVPCCAATSTCDNNASTLQLWVQCRLDTAKASLIPSKSTLANATERNPTKQTTSPAISNSSTSLVDHTSLADFATGAFNLAGFGGSTSGSATGQTSSGTTTVSAYAIYSAIRLTDPLDPAFYADHPNWRRFTFTVGTGTAPANAKTTTTTTSSSGSSNSRVFAASALLMNGRDFTANKRALDQLKDDISALGNTDAETYTQVESILYSLDGGSADPLTWQNSLNTPADSTALKALLKKLSADSVASGKVDAVFEHVRAAYLAQKQRLDNLVHSLQGAPQLSLSLQGAVADSKTQPSDYRVQLAFEQGLPGDNNFTANTSFDYVNSATVGADTRGARAAIDLQHLFNVTAATAKNKKPISVDLSGESDWFQSFKPSYVGQLKLSIPIAQGVDFPLSVSYGSSSNLLHEAGTIGKFGLTFDLSLIAKAITKQ